MPSIGFRFRKAPRAYAGCGLAGYPTLQFPDCKSVSMRQLRSQRGYILLVLLLSVALLSIGFLAVVRNLEFQMRRDREEELIHRGVQYSRAVRHYFKKFGRYPTKIEDLENTNNIRFLRKRYKDPLNRDPKTGKEKDFKLLHLQDVQTSFSSGQIRGAVAASDLASAEPAQSSNEVQAGAPGALDGSVAAPSGPGPSAIAGQQGNPQTDQTGAGGSPGTPPAPQPLVQQLGPNGAPQVFGGGAITGVASLSKEKTIRVFNKKDHYNQWQFVYDPTSDRGGLLMTPNQPPLMNAAQNVNQQQQNGQSGSFGVNGQNQGTFGQPANNNQNLNAPPQPTMPPDQNQ
jgi:type II secretory pathway pseudopilin PulG